LLVPAIAAVSEPDYEAYHEMPEGFNDSVGDDPEADKRVWLESKYYEALMHQFSARKDITVCLLHVWFALFLAAQLNGDVNWNWGLVMLPVWLYFGVHIVVWRYLKRMGLRLLDGIDVEKIQSGEIPFDPKMQVKFQVGMELVQASSSSFYGRIPHLLLVLLLVSRLEVSKFSTFWILIPIFFAIFVCICFVGCGICCLTMADPNKLNEGGNSDVYANAATNHAEEGDFPSDQSCEEASRSLMGEGPIVYAPPTTESHEKYGTFSPPLVEARVAAPVADSNDID